ncbi:MAG: prephenate dehydratase [Alphaproteobacteria bacterium]|jgi:prephenate dehydratase|nr:prephenate dehydratase [Alphaproteobacteria bacterium]MCB1551094.1 prephenate dehydratase [Alphaproteobacteria bacterium]MCB9985775.1 prephenate dehydratase [Micavibrio sp.]HPQ50306.1 prephenate dehydratase [Alphaproteobacteria bacterium]HRK97593.1 prephenate dehydratase [Alphaproteobacteria bacterium]
MTQNFALRTGKIAFQGTFGAFSDMSCRAMFPKMETVPCLTFEEAFGALEQGSVDLAMIAVDNSLAGRVADVHHLLPQKKMFIIGEHFQPVSMCLLAIKGAQLSDLKDVHSHTHALPQCRKVIKDLGLIPHVHADTAGAAEDVAQWNDKSQCAIASKLAAEIYGLEILREGIQDIPDNTTRFLVFSKEMERPTKDRNTAILTSFFFEVRNIPAALYKAMGGFATNGVQMTKLESYIDPQFNVARFYAEVLGSIDDRSLGLAFEELNFFAKDLQVMGSYPAHKFRGL